MVVVRLEEREEGLCPGFWGFCRCASRGPAGVKKPRILGRVESASLSVWVRAMVVRPSPGACPMPYPYRFPLEEIVLILLWMLILLLPFLWLLAP